MPVFADLLSKLLGRGPRAGSGQAVAVGMEPGAPITRDHVVWAYRLLLDRDPENEQVIQQRLQPPHNYLFYLRHNIMLSEEFQSKNPDFAQYPDGTLVIKELKSGQRLYVDLSDLVIGKGIVQDAYESEELDILKSLIREGDSVLDIGANIGLFAITMAGIVGETGHVYAFEPLTPMAEMLRKSIAENRFEDRITLEQKAVGDEVKQVTLVFARHARNKGAAQVLTAQEVSEAVHDRIDVQQVRIDDYEFKQPIKLIKMDIEGSEPFFIKGAEQLIRRDRPVILAEVNPWTLDWVAGYKADQFVREVMDLGYTCNVLSEHGETPVDLENLQGSVKSVVFRPR